MVKTGPLFADILIVDSDPDFVRGLRVLLQSAGYIVHSAPHGAGALDMVKTAPPDLILLNVNLPGMDGYETIRRIRAETALPFIPIILVMDQAHQDIAAGLNAGADEFIGKPVNNTELLARVRAMLRLKVTTDELVELNATLEQKVIERTRQLEEAHAHLRHAEKLASLGRLAASIAHEINNPLTGILNYTYLIKAELPPDSAVQEDMAMIERQIQVIATLVQQLRDFSKPPRRERRPTQLNRVWEDVLALTAKDLQKHHITLVHDFDAHLPLVIVSPEQMSEVFMNLVLNARDAMPEGGQLTVRTRAEPDRVRIEVIDTGTGIAPEVMDHLFEPFFTTKGERGTGLGLAICHSIIHDHGGDISVRSQPGQGTTFVVKLPMPEKGHQVETAERNP